ncbi:NADH:ubiquinone reductase (Na(+)-transporting) subunit F [Winogradskyella thalassocola]|uniref:Na(+)-translocating NADH-quinone reductase subunit F n=1 Tax=Winogradskyella thalassocola TaxID=262004 RepID=A0A1G7X0K7_9FLAO|nr:NADH:ubiquinone reductase (Na(+)-transporting) subunit F [Winogradskyella thalassocola]SDG77709.1 NADH:ubiquinone oxidoreductase, Na(+)-translocating, F subunit [Winogradskyella thalassocola]
MIDSEPKVIIHKIHKEKTLAHETSMPNPKIELDYSLTGKNATRAIELGLAEADWYQTPVPRKTMRKLLVRKDGPAIVDTMILVAILISSAAATILLWGTWWVLIPYLIYAVFYSTSSDSRWHECSHGTAFKTDWMNNVVYEVASFMVMRESVVWRWSHTRHHSDTIIVGRDPEIQIPRPPNIKNLILSIFNWGGYKTFFPSLIRHAFGKITASEKTYIPETEFGRIFKIARIYLAIYTTVICLSIILGSWIPIFLFVLPQIFGTWLMIVHNTTQHAGLAENVLDHRLNCRTVYMNPISRFIYWNMNYHTEHHMFPLVPYHALPKLHELIKDDCPPVYTSIYDAWSEIIPAIKRQVKEPGYYVKRKLPEAKTIAPEGLVRSNVLPDAEGWLEICSNKDLEKEDIIRFDHVKKTFALFRDNQGCLHATDGICTHGNTHLSEGLIKGKIIECPKHNGRFNIEDGSPARAPICQGLATYPIENRNDKIWLNIEKAGGAGSRKKKSYNLKVISNQNVSTFIKELILEPINTNEEIEFVPGDYMQIDIPEYNQIQFNQFDIPEPYASVWNHQRIFDLNCSNTKVGRANNYSLANNGFKEHALKFNVRIATPPPGQDCPPGIGSSYLFNLKPGDNVTATGSFGDFHIKPTHREMVYIGGGAGMAPIRSHIAHLFENESTHRKVSYWYGARSKQEIFYDDYFKGIQYQHANFNFQIALSEPLEEDKWEGQTGFIHQVVFDTYLKTHPNPKALEFYLCGPPKMIKACTKMLTQLGVTSHQIAFDEF